MDLFAQLSTRTMTIIVQGTREQDSKNLLESISGTFAIVR